MFRSRFFYALPVAKSATTLAGAANNLGRASARGAAGAAVLARGEGVAARDALEAQRALLVGGGVGGLQRRARDVFFDGNQNL